MLALEESNLTPQGLIVDIDLVDTQRDGQEVG